MNIDWKRVMWCAERGSEREKMYKQECEGTTRNVSNFHAFFYSQHETPSAVPLRLGTLRDGQTTLTRTTSLII